MEIRMAQRQKAKIKAGFSGVSYSGKTISALRFAFGLVGDWSKIFMIDTENRSGDLAVGAHGIGAFPKIDLTAPFSPDRYVEAINMCIRAGAEVIIIDSISHEWEGAGGCLDIVEQTGGKWQDWSKVTPKHELFKNTILQAPVHVITTVRRKQEHQLIQDKGGQSRVVKIGTKDITRENWEYELTINFIIETSHKAVVSKDRTSIFSENVPFLITEEDGKKVREWCEQGEDEWEIALNNCKSKQDLVALYAKAKLTIDNSPALQARFSKRRDILEGKAVEVHTSEAVPAPVLAGTTQNAPVEAPQAEKQPEAPAPVQEPAPETAPVESPENAPKSEEAFALTAPVVHAPVKRGRKKKEVQPEEAEPMIEELKKVVEEVIHPDPRKLKESDFRNELRKLQREGQLNSNTQANHYLLLLEKYDFDDEQRKMLDSVMVIDPTILDNANMES